MHTERESTACEVNSDMLPLKDFKLDHWYHDISCFEIFSQRNGPWKGIQYALANSMIDGRGFPTFLFFPFFLRNQLFSFCHFKKYHQNKLLCFSHLASFLPLPFTPYLKRSTFCIFLHWEGCMAQKTNSFSFRRILMVIFILGLLHNFQNL